MKGKRRLFGLCSHITPHASAIYDEYLDLYFDELARLLATLGA